MISKIEVERFTLRSSKSFDQVVAALNSAVGHPNMSDFWKSTDRAQSVAELQSTIEKVLGRTGLMLFAEFDHGAIVRKGTGRDTPRMIRFVIGNPLIMRRIVGFDSSIFFWFAIVLHLFIRSFQLMSICAAI